MRADLCLGRAEIMQLQIIYVCLFVINDVTESVFVGRCYMLFICQHNKIPVVREGRLARLNG